MIGIESMQDEAVMVGLKSLMRSERKGQAQFLAHLSEVDVRKLFLKEGFGSLFKYCTGELGLSEASSSKRIQVARLCRHPAGAPQGLQASLGIHGERRQAHRRRSQERQRHSS